MKYYKLINGNGWGKKFKEGTIYPGNYKSTPSFTTDVTYYATMGIHRESWELSTKKAYNKQEGIIPKPRVKKVVEVISHEFKVGDKVEFIHVEKADGCSLDWGIKDCIIGQEYTVSEVHPSKVAIKVKINGENTKHNFWINKHQFKLSTETKQKESKMKNYSIEGSKALKTAFVEECKLKTYNSITLNYGVLTSESMPLGTVQGGCKASQHFVLPKDWDAAVKYVKEFLKPDQPEFKVCGYESKLDKENKSVSFGCKTISKKQVEAVITAAELCNYIGFTAKVTSDGIKFIVGSTDKTYLTLEELKQILKAIK